MYFLRQDSFMSAQMRKFLAFHEVSLEPRSNLTHLSAFLGVREISVRNMSDKNGPYTGCTAPELLLKVVLAGTLTHYETRGLIDEKRLEHMLHAGKQILYKSHQESDVRYVLEVRTLWEKS